MAPFSDWSLIQLVDLSSFRLTTSSSDLMNTYPSAWSITKSVGHSSLWLITLRICWPFILQVDHSSYLLTTYSLGWSHNKSVGHSSLKLIIHWSLSWTDQGDHWGISHMDVSYSSQSCSSSELVIRQWWTYFKRLRDSVSQDSLS